MDRDFETEIKRLVKYNEFVVLTHHARVEARADTIEVGDIIEAIISGEMIEDYPAVTRTHDCLFCGWSSGRPIHALCTVVRGDVLIITTYIPDLSRWNRDFRTGRKE